MIKSDSLIKEVLLNAPASKVWKAITDKNQMKEWYFDFKEFKPEVGFEFQFESGPDDRTYLHLCKIAEVVPEKKLSYSWRYDGYPGDSLVTFELFEEGNQTRLKLTHENLESFGTDNPDFVKENFTEGWEHIIGKNIKEFIEKND